MAKTYLLEAAKAAKEIVDDGKYALSTEFGDLFNGKDENNNEIIQAGIKHLNNQINDFILAGVIASLMGNLYIGFLMEFSYVLLRCYAGGYHARNENIQLLEYKKKYQKKINVVVNNIDMVASSDKELNEKVYNRCLKCGSGIDSLVLSQDGYFRPCPELPESVFNLGGLDYLIDFINGNFRGDQLYQCIKKFCNEKDMIPCGALQEYYEKNICR